MRHRALVAPRVEHVSAKKGHKDVEGAWEHGSKMRIPRPRCAKRRALLRERKATRTSIVLDAIRALSRFTLVAELRRLAWWRLGGSHWCR